MCSPLGACHQRPPPWCTHISALPFYTHTYIHTHTHTHTTHSYIRTHTHAGPSPCEHLCVARHRALPPQQLRVLIQRQLPALGVGRGDLRTHTPCQGPGCTQHTMALTAYIPSTMALGVGGRDLRAHATCGAPVMPCTRGRQMRPSTHEAKHTCSRVHAGRN